ncbi:MAG: T9SS type A sorting domain-containing protein, partial [Calditrichia bacterium]
MRTEEANINWIRRFILFHNKKHPKEMGAKGRTNMSVYCFESKIPDTVFCGGDAGGALFRSYNNGKIWTKIGNFYYVRTLGMSNEGDIYLGTTSNGIWKSEDNGNNWIQTGLGNFYYVWAITFNSLGAIYAGTEQHGVFKSLDGGQSWIQTNDGLLNTNVFSIAINYNDELFAGTLEGLYVFDADSNHWKISLPDLAVGDIVIDSNSTMYAGTNSGVYSSDDNGANWTPLPHISPTGIEGLQSQTFKNIILEQNYPNPFNPATSIQYSIAGNHHVLLTVYDLLGKEIAIIVDEDKPAGAYTVQFDASNLSSGIYFYQ